MREERCTAVNLAAGTGSRMKSSVAKQFLELAGKPLIYYALHAAEESGIIDECLLVTGENDRERVRREIVEKYHFQKVKAILPGGSERCFSVANAMEWLAAEDRNGGDETVDAEKREKILPGISEEPKDLINSGKKYVFIHDGARPFLSEDILERTFQAARKYDACVAAVPSKDTVKIADEEGFADRTPDRRHVWTVQTPQVFERELITGAYAKLMDAVRRGESLSVTDDASVVELFTDVKVRLMEGSYRNIKITTPEDMAVAEALMKLE